MTSFKMKVAFKKIIKDKELMANLINVFLIVGQYDFNTAENDIQFIQIKEF